MKVLLSGQACLRVFGSPKVHPNYSASLQAMSVPDNTKLERRVPNVRVPTLLAVTDVLAVPSLWYENSPVVIQEAHAVGVPVLTSDLGALTEKVRGGVDGKLIPPGDVDAWRSVLQGLVDDPGQLKLWRAGVEAPLSINDHVEQLERHYTQVMPPLRMV